MRGLLVVIFACFIGGAQGGTITSGGFLLVGQAAFASASGDNFSAGASDTDLVPFNFNGFPPFQPPIFGFFVGGGNGDSVTYNGISYFSPPLSGPFPGMPYALVAFGVNLLSPPPIVTGPGTYDLGLVSVTLNFGLFDSSNTMFYSETDTGFATASITYTAFGPDNPFLLGHGIVGTIIPPVPEPSSWSFIVLAVCFGFPIARRTRRSKRANT